LEDFDISWNSLTPSAKQLWSKGAEARSYSPAGFYLGREIESWYTWSKIFKKIWSAQINDYKLSTHEWLSLWTGTIGRMPVWTYPDMKVESNDHADLAMVMDAWYAMKQKAFFEEFARRWKDDAERQGLWNEIMEFYGVGDLFPQMPPGPPNWLPTGRSGE
jgi:hypothetical protein